MESFSLAQIAQIVEANHIKKDWEEIVISNIAPLDKSQTGDIAFFYNPHYESSVYTSSATAILVPNTFQAKRTTTAILIPVEDVQIAQQKLLLAYEKIMQQTHLQTGIETHSFVSDDVKLGENVSVSAFAYIDKGAVIGDNVHISSQVYIGRNVHIGNGTVIESGVKIYHNSRIGANVHIDFNACIGAKGFGYIKSKEDGT